MKKLLLVLSIGAFAACNNSASSDSKNDSTGIKMAADSAKARIDSTAKAGMDTIKAKVDSAKK